ncbi:acyltransferase domain-containing protein [Streptomyces sp. BPTC-684]|uniref:acyltransferase domain-containing protein n=1 Tax=Streptomyces sp. BPTC-684 TaxID=3043734 RepID=UPI0024B0FF5A|nr:acyltransferase domain-containing protein [Streptomyces sp. BPTC-684]WHM40059.1 acyltransferase domain-containing protein [Streptomyces sp. BPTC-684]
MNDRKTVLLLPGQGSQRERMAAGLYGTQPEFTARMDEFLAAAGSAGAHLAEQWLRPAPNAVMDTAQVAQPLLLAVGHALGRAVAAHARPADLLLGHSVGELAAACLAGVYRAEDLAAVAAARSRALDGSGLGAMLAVAAAPHELPDELGPVSIAAVNGPRQTVLSGPPASLEAARVRLHALGRTVRVLRSGHAFHSPSMTRAARRFGAELARLRPGVPHTTVISSRTARPVTPAQARDASFWADQLALPVRYWPALRAVLDAEGTAPGLLLLDAGADRSLSAPARHHPAVRAGDSLIVPLLAPARETGGLADLTAFEAALTIARG